MTELLTTKWAETAIVLLLATGYVLISMWWRALQDRLGKAFSDKGVLLEVVVDHDDNRDPFDIRQIWSTVHSIGGAGKSLRSLTRPEPYLSFEIHSIRNDSKGINEIRFYLWVPEKHVDTVISRLRATYPHARITQIENDKYISTPATDPHQRIFAAAELNLKHHYALALRSYDSFDKSDPLNAITAAMAEMKDRNEAVVQVLMRPVDSSWETEARQIIREYERTGRKPKSVNPGYQLFTLVARPFVTVGDLIRQLILTIAKPDRIDHIDVPKEEVSTGMLERMEQRNMSMKAVEHRAYALKINLAVASAYDSEDAHSRLRAMIAAFNELEGDNEFVARTVKKGELQIFMERMQQRYFPNDHRNNIISAIEIAAFCHFPGASNQVRGIKFIRARDIAGSSQISRTDYFAVDAQENLIGLSPEARMRHVFAMGKTGVGKSTLLERMIINDIHSGRGVILLDPHGDLAESVIAKIDSSRPDIYVFRPFDWERPAGLNILEIESIDESTREMEKQLVIDHFITTLKRVFPEGSIGASSDDFFRMAASALVDQPDGASFLEVLLILTSESYREKAKEFISVPQVRHYWEVNFPRLVGNQRTEALLAAPLNKTRRFVGDRMISRIICQMESTLNIKNIMDSGGVLICNLSQGLCGEENSTLLGAMILAKIQIAAMMRANIPFEQRTPCYVYVDEFQNFVGNSESAARSFEKVLSEARKYRLSLTMANQYLGQLTPGLRSAIFGNCGSVICFQVGHEDAQYLEPFFDIGNEPLSADDLKRLEKYKIAARLLNEEGETDLPLTAMTLPPVEASPNADPEALIERSRTAIGVDRTEVERDIMRRMREYDRHMPDID